ncbi:MAG: hypothetical protein ACPGLV_14000 [Bacteroidia bacterium]
MASINPNFDDLNSHAENMASGGSLNLKKIQATHEKLKELKAKEIKFSSPILTQNANPVIFPHTINVIQGQAGVHKSRIAETICSAMIKTHGCENHLLGYKRNNFEISHTVVYVDTERNLSEQLPFALQSIQIKAGYNREDNPTNFDFISLLEINRKERFLALNEYLEQLRKDRSTPLFIVLDVSTDCIEDFNRTSDSMQLIDLMNVAINEHNVVFLCLIHENPNSNKARGHFGTELMNKASTVIQVGFEKNSSNEPTELIKVKYLKCRSTKKHDPFHVKYCDTERGLVLADASDVSQVINNRKHKASNEDLIDFIELQLGDGTTMPRPELLELLCAEFKASARTIEERLKVIIENDSELFDNDGNNCRLEKDKEEKKVIYKLKKRD